MSDYAVLRAADAPDFTGDPTRGHSHVTIEELYFVLEGEITVKADDDGEDEATFALCSVKVNDHAAESRGHDDFWPTG